MIKKETAFNIAIKIKNIEWKTFRLCFRFELISSASNAVCKKNRIKWGRGERGRESFRISDSVKLRKLFSSVFAVIFAWFSFHRKLER
jgi:hypothetical protein